MVDLDSVLDFMESVELLMTVFGSARDVDLRGGVAPQSCVHTEGVSNLHVSAGVRKNKHARSYPFAIYRVHTYGSALMSR